MNIQGSVALITGANGGLGTEFIKALLAAGVGKIYACARRIDSLNATVQLDPSRVVAVQVDVTKPAEVEAAAKQCTDVTLLFNNAGVSKDQGVISAPNMDGVRAEMETNFFGTMAMCRAFAPVLKANGGGAIINIVSLLGKINLPFMGTYSCTKAAELSLTQCVRAELAGQKTLVIGVMPGTIDTKFAVLYPDPKVSPEEVVRATLQAIVDEEEDIYPGEQAAYVSGALLQDPKAVEKQLAGMLPGFLEQLQQQKGS
ncbi:MAG TPA: SDR family oxidoreductase [Oscillatoriaceae cyanobacterium M33_DOE_052]|uniref:SDR family NAD(P)-dependent oxidoreductase n=1 Tax=Planktothricoides sp. SpSt-374 TaxID=2282167 RepID=A0A7C3ZVR6_9CYAN|nr:SDR family oxidoreductase [Oscillatoriaceae cyanobacterium M33_DOE_052]